MRSKHTRAVKLDEMSALVEEPKRSQSRDLGEEERGAFKAEA